MNMTIVAAHAQSVDLSTCAILNLYFVGNRESRDVKLRVMGHRLDNFFGTTWGGKGSWVFFERFLCVDQVLI